MIPHLTRDEFFNTLELPPSTPPVPPPPPPPPPKEILYLGSVHCIQFKVLFSLQASTQTNRHFKFAFIKLINHLFTIVLDDLPLLYEAPEGSQPSSRADHDDRAAGAERKAETGVTDKDGNTNIRNTCKTRRKSSLKGGLVSLIKLSLASLILNFYGPESLNKLIELHNLNVMLLWHSYLHPIDPSI